MNPIFLHRVRRNIDLAVAQAGKSPVRSVEEAWETPRTMNLDLFCAACLCPAESAALASFDGYPIGAAVCGNEEHQAIVLSAMRERGEVLRVGPLQ